MEPPDLDNEFGYRAVEQFMELFVTPEVKRRQDNGELDRPLDLRGAQIIFFPDDRKPQVRINSEVVALAMPKWKPGLSKEEGEPVYEHESEGIEDVWLGEEDDPNCGHVTLLRIGGRWSLAFDFRYNKVLSKQHIETAEQFYEAAEFSFKQRNWSAFIDNLFSAAELSAKSILLSEPDPTFREKATHKTIKSRYNRWHQLGNLDTTHRETFNELSDLRGGARYLKGNISITEAKAEELLSTVRGMIEDAALRAS